MENLFIIMIFTGGFGLLLCSSVGLQILGFKALNWFKQLRNKQNRKKFKKWARMNFDKYNIIIK